MGKVFGAVGVMILFSVVSSQCHRAPTDTDPIPVAAYAPTQEEAAAERKQNAEDRAFFAAKAKREEADANAYQKQQAMPERAPTAESEYARLATPTPPPVQNYSVFNDANYGSTRRGEDGAPRSQHVSGYTRKDGTHVQAYSRRHR